MVVDTRKARISRSGSFLITQNFMKENNVAMVQKGIFIKENLWWWRGKFLFKATDPTTNRNTWYIYNKYEGGKPVDFMFMTVGIKSLKDILDIFSEKLDHPIRSEERRVGKECRS